MGDPDDLDTPAATPDEPATTPEEPATVPDIATLAGDETDADAPNAPADGAVLTGEPAQIPQPDTASTTIDLDAPATPRRSRGALVAAVVGVIALLAAGTFAIVKIAGGGDDGGAASPSEAGTELIAALEEEDVLGVVDLLLPSERDTLRQPIVDLVDDLKRLEVLSAEASLEDVGGVDLRFTGVQVAEEPTNVPDITNIVLSGSATAVVNGAEVPIGDFLLDEVFDGERPEMDAPQETSEFADVRLTTVERDGRWYLSAFYSIAETARGRDSEQDIPTAGLAADGADEPQLAVDEVLNALIATDVARMLALLDPTEVEALHRYAPLFLGEAEEVSEELPVEATISNVQYTVEGEGDRRSVGIESIAVTITEPEPDGDEPMTITMTYAEGCLVVTGMGEDATEVCGTQFDSMDELAEQQGFGDSEATKELFDAFTAAFADFDPSGIAVHEVDGSWYVSPLRTFSDGLQSVLNALDRPGIERLVEASNALLNEIFSGTATDCVSIAIPSDSVPADGEYEYEYEDSCLPDQDA